MRRCGRPQFNPAVGAHFSTSVVRWPLGRHFSDSAKYQSLEKPSDMISITVSLLVDFSLFLNENNDCILGLRASLHARDRHNLLVSRSDQISKKI